MTEVRKIAADLAPCLCVSEHRPAGPFNDIHHLDPLGEGGPDTPENRIPACGPTHDWAHVIYRSFKKAGSVLPRQTGQPKYAYSLAVRGFNATMKRRAAAT